jgi:hypothetical protein
MFAIARLFLGLFQKDHLLLADYRREHPHFFLYLSADAAISCLLVFGGFQIARANTPPTLQNIQAEHAGAIAMTENQLTQHVRADRRIVYWLGPVSTWAYAPNCITPGLYSVAYLPNGQSDLANIHTQEITIQTYANDAALAAHATGNPPDSVQIAKDSRGDLVSYDPSNMRWATVNLKGKAQVVKMNFPQIQNASELIQDAETLTLIV